MIKLNLKYEDGSTKTITKHLPISIGRCNSADLQIKAWRVAKLHALLEFRDAGVFISDLGALTGTLVNGMRISEYGPLNNADEIIIGPCLIKLVNNEELHQKSHEKLNNQSHIQPHGQSAQHATNSQNISSSNHMHINNDVSNMNVVGASDVYVTTTNTNACDQKVSNSAIDITPNKINDDYKNEYLCSESINTTDTNCFSNSDNSGNNNNHDNIDDKNYADANNNYYAQYQQRSIHRQRLHNELLNALDLRRRDIASMSDKALRSEATRLLQKILANDEKLPQQYDHAELLTEVVNEAVGLGPLEPLLADHSISEIMVNRFDEIFIESNGKINRYKGGFSSEQAVQGVIDRIVSPLGRRIDESSPMVDARLKDGSRVNAVIPPISLRGSSITIRKFPSKRPTIKDLINIGALDVNMAIFLQECVKQRKNIIVSGGTGSGKTTLLNILSNFIPTGERIVTIEDAAELQLSHQHLVSLESRPANLEGKGAVYIRDLVRNALRMRPDRIVVGECRGSEAFDMLAAMNTGHEGSLTTLHANSARDALARLETMILMAGMDLPLNAVREQISSSIDIIVQQARLSSGRRVITAIVQITGQENNRIQLQELFKYQHQPQAAFLGCNVLPENFDLSAGNINIDLFSQITKSVSKTAPAIN